MKKLVFMFVAMAAISFASCGNKTEQGAAQDSINADSVPQDSDTVTVATEKVDSLNK